MKTVKKILGLIPALILWLMFSVLLWGFVFTRITDTAPAFKITVCVDAGTPGATALAAALEEAIGGGIRMVKVRPFTYAMMDSAELTGADVYLARASSVETYREWFDPLPEEMREAGEILYLDGVPLGVRVYDAETGAGVAAAYIDYALPEGEEEDFYLLFGRQSLHVPGHEGAVDQAALTAARLLLGMQ